MVEFIPLPFPFPGKLKFGYSTSQLCSEGKEMYKKAWCTCRVVVLLIKPIVFWPSRCRCRLGFVRSLLWSQRPKRFLGFTKPVSGSSIADYSALPFNKISQAEDCCSRKVTHSLRNIAWWTTAAIGVCNICLAPFSRQTNPNRTNLANYEW